VLQIVLSEIRSKTSFIPSTLSVKAWREGMPSVGAARPSHCPGCGFPSRVAGERLGLHGHGVRSRQQRGPISPWMDPEVTEVTVRRYRCTRCGGVCTTGPGEVLPRHLYSGPAIAWALALVGLQGARASAVRRLVSPWRRVGASAAGRWRSLGRWQRAVIDGRLFSGVTTVIGLNPHCVAERIATVIAAQAPPSASQMPHHDRAFFGAASCTVAIA
jgi:hypothetical protein